MQPKAKPYGVAMGGVAVPADRASRRSLELADLECADWARAHLVISYPWLYLLRVLLWSWAPFLCIHASG